MSQRNVEDIYKLSPVQQGILFHAVYDPSAVAYHEQFFQDLPSDAVDEDLFVGAWRRLLARHPILRTSFVWEGLEDPVQVVHRTVEPDLVRVDLSGRTAGGQEARERAWADVMEADRRRGFDLSKPPLARLSLVEMGAGMLRVLVSYHHLLLDGWSAMVVLRELFALYEALQAGVEPELPERRPFRDYIAWLRRQDLDEARAFWQRLLDGVEEPTPLCDRGPDTPAAAGVGRWGERSLTLSEETTDALRTVARARRLTLNTVVQAAWAWALSRACGRRDVVFGTTVAGRPPGLRGVETMVGCFINTLPVRVRLPDGGDLAPWLEGIQETLTELRRFEHSPLVDIRRWAGIPADRALFDSILVFENFDAEAGEGERAARFQRTNYPLTVIGFPERRLELQATWERHRFRPGTVERLLETVRVTLEALAAAPQRVAGLPAAPPAELHRVLVEWNDTERAWNGGGALGLAGAPAAGDSLLHELIEHTAAIRPGDVAVEIEGSELTYGELAERSGRLARRLRALGVGPEVPVGVAAERSLELIVGLLAVLEAGGFYVPLDPGYPAERLAFMVADSGVPVLLTQERIAGSLPECAARVVLLDAAAADGAGSAAPAARVAPSQLAYAIYTSGSTGRPKGAMNSHRGIVNRLLWMQAEYRLDPSDRVLQKTPFSFDVSVWELFWPLVVGARLVLAKPGGHQDADYLVELIRRAGITTMHFVPSMLQVFLEAEGVESCTSLRRVLRAARRCRPTWCAATTAGCWRRSTTSTVRPRRRSTSPTSRRPRATSGADRPADGQHPGGRPRRRIAAAARRRGRRAAPGRCPARPRLPGTPGADRGALRPGSPGRSGGDRARHGRRAALPHRRPGQDPAGRGGRVPRPRRLPGEGAWLPHRAG